MRALKYRLADGTVVNTMAEAKASGQHYETFMEPIRDRDIPQAVSPIRQAMLEQFGYVSANLKDKVTV